MAAPSDSLRRYEDLAVGETTALGPLTVSKEMIISFAREFDPFPFHLDEKAAKASLLGGLAASGWQTAALSLRIATDALLGKIAAMGELGFSDLKWKKPVMVGDAISGTVTIAELRRSRSDPHRGIASIDFDMRNQRGEPVMTMRLACLVAVRNPAAGMMAQPEVPYDVTHGGDAM
jgi:acyl dehydratase